MVQSSPECEGTVKVKEKQKQLANESIWKAEKVTHCYGVRHRKKS